MTTNKAAGLPSYLKNMTSLERGVTRINQWPKDRRLQKLLAMHQAGKMLPLAPFAKDPIEMAKYRASIAMPAPTSQMDVWKKNRASLKTAYVLGAERALTAFGIHGVKAAGAVPRPPTLTPSQSSAAAMPSAVPKPATQPTAPVAAGAGKANLLG